jgi:hypothetical protein
MDYKNTLIEDYKTSLIMAKMLGSSILDNDISKMLESIFYSSVLENEVNYGNYKLSGTNFIINYDYCDLVPSECILYYLIYKYDISPKTRVMYCLKDYI